MSSLVYVKNPSGTTYVYENTTYWDKALKKCKHTRKCIGHLDPHTNEVVPNRKKGDRTSAKQANSANDAVTDANAVTETEQKATCTVSGVGLTMILDKAAKETGLKTVLQKNFGTDWQSMMTLAYYLVSDGRALSYTQQWQNLYESPSVQLLSGQRISELLVRITPSLQADFFKMWTLHHPQDAYYAMDITSISSYSKLISFARRGYNRDGEDLPQVNLMMLTGQTSSLPLYYRVMPGGIKDVNTLTESLSTMKHLGGKGIHYVMDKGFYSKANIDAMFLHRVKFVIGVPFTTTLAKDAVEEVRESIQSHHHYCSVMGNEVYAVTKTTQWNGHRCYAHVYYDSLKAESEKRKLDHLLLSCYEELCSETPVKEHESYYRRFFKVKKTPVRGIHVEYDEEAIAEHKRNYAGWFVLLSNKVREKTEALRVYRQKDVVEKSFDDLKNDLDMKRLRIHSDAAMDGKLFIHFLALILSTWIKQKMHEQGLLKRFNLQEVLEEMKSFRKVCFPDRRKPIFTHPSKAQGVILEAFGL